MIKFLPLITAFFWLQQATAQDYTGQWKGVFVEKSSSFMGWGGEQCEYVLELECKGEKVTGFSYTYFNDVGKRYFTICRLVGKVDKANQYVEVREVERTKTNVPMEIRNCFQIHRLNFSKSGNKEMLEGTWIPAPNQEGDCGKGTTMLSRRVLTKAPPSFNKTAVIIPKKNNNLPDLRDKNKTNPPIVKTNPQQKEVITPSLPPAKKETVITQPAKVDPGPPAVKKDPVTPPVKTDGRFEKRNNSLVKTIEVENETFRVDLYDNGEIDGDTISVFYNGKLLLAHKRLTDKAITINLDANDNQGVNELVMYAENLGSIPPNTALMIVTDGNNRYEVRISADTQKNGAIRFVHRKNTQ